ncbi:MAG: hypothetical protein NZO16_05680 [Deltaproteobacteria bacterium]|nr:hypothetical protein [Deltaproteobacteria bacterium]
MIDLQLWHKYYTDAPRLRMLQEIQNSKESIAALGLVCHKRQQVEK